VQATVENITPTVDVNMQNPGKNTPQEDQ